MNNDEQDRNQMYYEEQHGDSGIATQQGAALYLAKVMGWMCVGLLTTVASSMVCLMVPALFNALFRSSMSYYVIIFAQLGLVLFFTARLEKMSVAGATISFMVYSALTGATMSVLALIFQLSSIVYVLGITGLVFLAMAVYGFATKSDLTGIGKLAIFGLFGIIICGVVNVFTRSSMFDFAVSVVAVLIFMVLIAYDTQKIKAIYASAMDTGYTEESDQVRKLAIYGAFTLYLDFINLFIRLLRIMGKRRN